MGTASHTKKTDFFSNVADGIIEVWNVLLPLRLEKRKIMRYSPSMIALLVTLQSFLIDGSESVDTVTQQDSKIRIGLTMTPKSILAIRVQAEISSFFDRQKVLKKMVCKEMRKEF